MHPLLSTAVRCARAAGNVILNHLDRVDRIKVERKGRGDYVSEVDRMAEERIVSHLRRAYPDHRIVAEESGASKTGGEFVWFIDPLDGTTNYLHGYPEFAVSIAVARRGVLEHGVVFRLPADELFTASRGEGARLNERRIRCSAARRFETALLGTDFPIRRPDLLEPSMKSLRAVLARAGGIRRSGSAAADLANLAAGRLDGFWECGLRPWDVAAGALMIREAGGLVADFDGGQNFLDTGEVVAATPQLFNELLTLVRSGR